MKKIENECVGCTEIGLPCLGIACPKRNVPHWYCDECGEEEELYHYDGRELCIECIKNLLEKVED